jgi:hypothetical protein
VAHLLNHLAQPDLNWRTSIEACYGITPDISALLLFAFYERVYYLDAESHFPNSKEKAGRFVGIAENVGDALTFWILTEDTQQLIARSVVRTTEDPKTANKCLDQLQPDIQSHQVVIGIRDLNKKVILP